MRRANNNHRGQWVEVVFKSTDNKKVCGPVFYGYIMKTGTDSKIMVAFTKAGQLFDSGNLKVLATSPINPPKWAANLWDISDEADRVNHYAHLYDARYKTIITDCYEGRLTGEIRDFEKRVDFLTKLKAKEPWA